MKVELESTSRLVEVNGVPARVWQGKSAGGARVVFLVTRIAVPEGEPVGEFERELQENAAPRPEALAFPLRMIL